MDVYVSLRCGDEAGLAAALANGVDAVILDVEEPAGSDFVASAIATMRGAAAPPRAFVRIRPLAAGGRDDLARAMEAWPDAVVLPRAVGGRDVQRLGATLAVHEAEHGLADGTTGILAMGSDTAAGALALPTLPGSSRRLIGIGFDPEALRQELGGDEAVASARAMTLLAARAARAFSVLAAPADDADAFGGSGGFDALVLRTTAAGAAPRAGLRPASGVSV